MRDRFGGDHTTDNRAALASFEAAVFAVAAHRPIGDALTSALQLDPDLVAGHALQGLANVVLGRSETQRLAGTILKSAEGALARRNGGNARERALVDALRLASEGQLKAAAARLDVHLTKSPTDFLAVKLSHALRFMSGQPHDMVTLTRRVLPAWTPSDGGYGFVLGCHAFGLEETGQYGAAERYGREAYTVEPADAWGLHAVSHVMEMSHRIAEGAELLEATRENWAKCNNFSFHIAWHLALFRLEENRPDAVLELYDQEIRPIATDDFRDMANAASMLWRLELEGIPVGDRWTALHEIASRRRTDTTYMFGSLHYLLALAGARDRAGALELMAALEGAAEDADGDQGRVAAEVGLPLARVIMELGFGDAARDDLVDIASRLTDIGGSHAQRDVFLRTLIMAAARAGDAPSMLELSRIRHALRSSDRFISAVERRLADRSSGPVSLPPELAAS